MASSPPSAGGKGNGPERSTEMPANHPSVSDGSTVCPFTMVMRVLEERERGVIIPTEPEPRTADVSLITPRTRPADGDTAASSPGSNKPKFEKAQFEKTLKGNETSDSSGSDTLLTSLLPSPRPDEVNQWPEEVPALVMTRRRGSLQNYVIVEGAPLTQALLDQGLDDDMDTADYVDARPGSAENRPAPPPALVRRSNSFAGHGRGAAMPQNTQPLSAFDTARHSTTRRLSDERHEKDQMKCPFSSMTMEAADEISKNMHESGSQAGSSRRGAPVQLTSTGGSLRKTNSEGSRSKGSGRRSKAVTKNSMQSGSKGRTSASGRGKRGKKRVATEVIYSSWEAETYAPSIRESWQQALGQHSIHQIGIIFYEQLFVDIPEIQHMFSSGKDIMGTKFGEMLHAIVAAVDSEANLYSKLRALAPMHVEKGVSVEHMPRMGKVLFKVLEKILGSAFDRTVSAAWEWLWAWLSKVMQQTLEEVRFGSNVVSRSWNMAQDNFPDHEVGEVFFDTLFQFAPNLKSVYYKPKQILAGKFVEMLSTLVSYSGDKSRMQEQITWLGIRHVAYNVRSQHIKVLGDVLVKTMERCVGQAWTEEMCEEWLALWNSACESLFGVMEDAIKFGKTLDGIWAIVEKKTTEGHFGATLKRKLLSGTEWVATLNRRIKETDPKEAGTPLKRAPPGPSPRTSSPTHSTHGAGLRPGEGGLRPGEGASPFPPRSPRSRPMVPGSGNGSPAPRHASAEAAEAGPAEAEAVPGLLSKHGNGHAGPRGGSGEGAQQSPVGRGASPHGSGKGFRDMALLFRAPSAATFARQLSASQHTIEEIAELPPEKANDCDAIGREFWGLLKQSITLLWQPERQNEEIIVRAHSMFRWGIRSSQLETIGSALERTVQIYLVDAGAAWGEHEQDAWQWFWDIVERALQRTLDVCERDDAKIVGDSWELCKRLKPTEELGDLFFANLARIAPYIVPLFRRPKRIQAAQFIEAVNLLVKFGLDPGEFFHGFRGLVIRHIKYGVKAEYTKPFGQAILLGIQNTLGPEHWTEEVAAAWNDLWLRVSSCVSRSLNVGTNILVVALVQGDVEKLEQAARCAPRQERHNWMTSVDVNGEELSPVTWAIKDGKFNLVEFMLQDLLAIRADRDAYYYGREVLFTRHPDIVDLICRECPFLIDTLLDGLLWHSQFVDIDGTVRVNYYLEDIYGDPRKYPDAWKSCLAVLVMHGEPANFVHPVISKVLQLKWTTYCRNIFLLMQAWYIVLLAMLMVGNVNNVGNCNYQNLRIALAAASAATALVQTVFMVLQLLRRQTTSVYIWHNFHLTLPVWLCSSWNIQRYISCVLLPFATLLEPCHLQKYSAYHSSGEQSAVFLQPVPLADCDSLMLAGRAFSAVTALLLWTQAMQIFVVSTRLAALSWSLGVMFQDVSRNLIVVALFVVAWTSALTALQETQYEDFETGIVNLCRQVLSLSPPDNHDMHPISAVFLASFVVATNIGMMAILIAQIRSSYEVVARNKTGYALQHRAHICVDIESILPMSYRMKLFDQFNFDQPVPFDQGDLGPTGGVQFAEKGSIRKHAKYIPDRVMRYTGVSCGTDPWDDLEEDEELDPSGDEDNRD